MGQRLLPLALTIFLLIAAAQIVLGCKPAPPSTQPAKQPTIASLSPAATDLLIGIGATDHLVAVSNWDPRRTETESMPRVGDYRQVDWEKINELKPSVMITQFAFDKMPAGLAQRAETMKIRVVNIKIDSLKDIFTAMQTLGEAAGEVSKAAEADRRLHSKLDAVEQRVSSRPPVNTLIMHGATTLDVVGGNNFLDDVLTIAGGMNVMQGVRNDYFSIDPEKLHELNPDAVLQLLPSATPQVVQQAEDFWKKYAHLSAVKNKRVYIRTEPYLLLPGYSIGNIAEIFAESLHPAASTTAPAKGGS